MIWAYDLQEGARTELIRCEHNLQHDTSPVHLLLKYARTGWRLTSAIHAVVDGTMPPDPPSGVWGMGASRVLRLAGS